MNTVLVIAGSDSGGGAGIARDVRTLTELGLRPLLAVTAVTAQSDAGVSVLFPIPAQVVRAQIEAAFATRDVNALKIGMLATGPIVRAVAQCLRERGPQALVLDPVLKSSSGIALLDGPGRKALRELLLPQVSLLTPNIPEAAALLGVAAATTEEECLGQARQLLAWGPEAVLLKGGHGRGPESVDTLVTRSQGTHRLAGPRLNATLRGTGCALATAIAAAMANGLTLQAACSHAKAYVAGLLRNGG